MILINNSIDFKIFFYIFNSSIAIMINNFQLPILYITYYTICFSFNISIIHYKRTKMLSMQYKIVFDCNNLNQEQSRKFSKNCQILYRKFKFLVKFEIYITELTRLHKFRYLPYTYLI